MTRDMELVEPLEPTGEESPLARARLHRQLTVEETARRAGISADEVRWIEEGRVYRFPRPDDALVATVLYASALGIDHREARELAGLPVPPLPVERNPLPRLIVIGAAAIALAVFCTLLVVSHTGGHKNRAAPTASRTRRPRSISPRSARASRFASRNNWASRRGPSPAEPVPVPST